MARQPPPFRGEGGVTYRQSLCASPINHLLHACLCSASSLPRTRVRAAPTAAGHPLRLPPHGTGERLGPPGSAAPVRLLPIPPGPETGSRGAQGAPALGGSKPGWAVPPRGEGFGSPRLGWLLCGGH